VRPDSKLRSSFENLSKAMAGVEIDIETRQDTFKIREQYEDLAVRVEGPKQENEHKNLLSLVN